MMIDHATEKDNWIHQHYLIARSKKKKQKDREDEEKTRGSKRGELVTWSA